MDGHNEILLPALVVVIIFSVFPENAIWIFGTLIGLGVVGAVIGVVLKIKP